jgi:hypothetical protein
MVLFIMGAFLAIAFSPFFDWVGLAELALDRLVFDFPVFFFAAILHSPLADCGMVRHIRAMTPPDKKSPHIQAWRQAGMG